MVIKVRKSSIHGLGVFATKRFLKGEVVLSWKPERTISESEFGSLSARMKRYVMRWSSGQLILIPSPARYINHSCMPNTHTLVKGTDIALKEINIGEEITAHYLKPNGSNSISCNCGSMKCMGGLSVN